MEKTTQVKATKTIAEQVLNGSQELASDSLSSSGSELNITENVDDILPDYSELDQFTEEASKTGELSETGSEQNSENSPGMSNDDCMMIAAGGVSKLEWLASIYVGDEVVIDDKQKQDIAEKSAVVIKKHLGGEELPSWLKQWKEEISLGWALGTCAVAIYAQKKKVDAELAKQEGNTSEPSKVTSEKGHADAKASFDHSYIT